MACSICAGEARRLGSTTDGRYALLRCRQCDLVYSDPMPTPAELDAYYQGFAYSLPKAGELEGQTAYTRKGAKVFTRTVERLAAAPVRKVLDYGGGLGFFANAMADHYEAVTLFDLDGTSRDFARQHFAGRFRVVDTGEAALAEQYDLILINQVIEHVPDPEGFLRQFKDALAPGGLLIVTTPNNRTWDAWLRPDILVHYTRRLNLSRLQAIKMLATDSWLCCDPPRHLFAFNADNLAAVGRLAGFREVEVSTRYFDNDPYGQPKYAAGGSSSRALIMMILNGLTRISSGAAQLIDRKRRRGTTLIGYFTV